MKERVVTGATTAVHLPAYSMVWVAAGVPGRCLQ